MSQDAIAIHDLPVSHPSRTAMEEEQAHQLFQQFQKVDAAAKQKQGLGFGLSSTPTPVVERSDRPAGWDAPYKLSDKFQQQSEITARKRSRSPRGHSYRSEKRSRSDVSPEPQRYSHRSREKEKEKHSRQSVDRKSARHTDQHKGKHKQHEPRRHSRRHGSQSPDPHHQSRHHKSYKQEDRNQDSPRYHRRDRDTSTGHSQQRHYASSHDASRSDRHSSRTRRDTAPSSQHISAHRAPDHAKLIVGYKYMSDANRLKAVTAYKLQKTSSKDESNKKGQPWTRFVFNTDALLEEEGAAPDGPDQEGKGPAGLGAFDFRPHRAAPKGKSDEDAHEAAIFGAPATGSHEKLQQSSSPPPREADSDSEERPQIVELLEVQPQALPGADVDGVDSQQSAAAAAGLPKLSWRERALLKKQQQSGN